MYSGHDPFRLDHSVIAGAHKENGGEEDEEDDELEEGPATTRRIPRAATRGSELDSLLSRGGEGRTANGDDEADIPIPNALFFDNPTERTCYFCVSTRFWARVEVTARVGGAGALAMGLYTTSLFRENLVVGVLMPIIAVMGVQDTLGATFDFIWVATKIVLSLALVTLPFFAWVPNEDYLFWIGLNVGLVVLHVFSVVQISKRLSCALVVVFMWVWWQGSLLGTEERPPWYFGIKFALTIWTANAVALIAMLLPFPRLAKTKASKACRKGKAIAGKVLTEFLVSALKRTDHEYVYVNAELHMQYLESSIPDIERLVRMAEIEDLVFNFLSALLSIVLVFPLYFRKEPFPSPEKLERLRRDAFLLRKLSLRLNSIAMLVEQVNAIRLSKPQLHIRQAKSFRRSLLTVASACEEFLIARDPYCPIASAIPFAATANEQPYLHSLSEEGRFILEACCSTQDQLNAWRSRLYKAHSLMMQAVGLRAVAFQVMHFCRHIMKTFPIPGEVIKDMLLSGGEPVTETAQKAKDAIFHFASPKAKALSKQAPDSSAFTDKQPPKLSASISPTEPLSEAPMDSSSPLDNSLTVYRTGDGSAEEPNDAGAARLPNGAGGSSSAAPPHPDANPAQGATTPGGSTPSDAATAVVIDEPPASPPGESSTSSPDEPDADAGGGGGGRAAKSAEAVAEPYNAFRIVFVDTAYKAAYNTKKFFTREVFQVSKQQIREALKTATAVTLTAVLSLEFELTPAAWGPLTVGFLAAPSTSGSLSTAVNRIQGTVFGSLYSYSVLKSASVDNVVVTAAYGGICLLGGYVRAGNENYSYAGMVSILTSAIILTSIKQEDEDTVDDIAFSRTLQTMLACVVYMVVVHLFFPVQARELLFEELDAFAHTLDKSLCSVVELFFPDTQAVNATLDWEIHEKTHDIAVHALLQHSEKLRKLIEEVDDEPSFTGMHIPTDSLRTMVYHTKFAATSLKNMATSVYQLVGSGAELVRFRLQFNQSVIVVLQSVRHLIKYFYLAAPSEPQTIMSLINKTHRAMSEMTFAFELAIGDEVRLRDAPAFNTRESEAINCFVQSVYCLAKAICGLGNAYRTFLLQLRAVEFSI
eukprot:gene21493-33066_t